MIEAFNLSNNDRIGFNDNTSPLWAVCYGYCEQHNLMSSLFASAHDGNFLDYSKTLPVSVGRDTVACGDWATLTKEQ